MAGRTEELRVSTNYHFCNTYLPRYFYSDFKTFFDCFKDVEALKPLLADLLTTMESRGFEISSFIQGFKYSLWSQKGVMAIIMTIPNAKYETECNFLCLAFTKERPYYFESELFEGLFGEKEHFELCGRNGPYQHCIYHTSLEDIRTEEDIWNAALEIIGGNGGILANSK